MESSNSFLFPKAMPVSCSSGKEMAPMGLGCTGTAALGEIDRQERHNE